MATVLRKRKIIDNHYGSAPSQPSVASFARVSKAAVSRSGKKQNELQKKPQAIPTKENEVVTGKENKKRKVTHISEATSEKALEARSLNIEKKVPATKTKAARRGPSVQDTPINQRRIAPLKRGKVADSPTQGARAILEAFVIATPAPSYKNQDKPATNNRSSLSESQSISSLPATFPTEFQDLVNLHSAFLNALSLHYAHNGTSSPAILSELRPSIERIWGKRRVEASDIQRLLGIQHLESPSPPPTSLPTLSLVDFSRGKLGVEILSTSSIPAFGSPLPTSTFRARFQQSLTHLLSISDDTTTLPLAPIVLFAPDQAPSAPSKGAQRLSDIRATAQAAQVATAISDGIKSASEKISGTGKEGQKAPSRGASLLERIKAKEAKAASQPSGPSKEDLERRSALMRLEEIIPVIETLATRSSGGKSIGQTFGGQSKGLSSASADLAAALGMGSSRSSTAGSLSSGMGAKTTSFTIASLVQHLQMSLKHPISAEEADRCVGVLAKEVLPQWCQVREFGKVKSISVRGAVSRGEWVGRLRELLL